MYPLSRANVPQVFIVRCARVGGMYLMTPAGDKRKMRLGEAGMRKRIQMLRIYGGVGTGKLR